MPRLARLPLVGLLLILLFLGACSTVKPPAPEVEPALDPQTGTIELVRYNMDQWSGSNVTANRVENGYTASALSKPSGSNLDRFRRYDSTKYATHPVLQTVGNAVDAASAYARGRFFEFTLNGDLNLHELHLSVAKSSSSGDRGFSIRTSIDNYASVLLNVQNVPTVRPNLTSYRIDLGGAQFQGLTQITVRIYVHTNSTHHTRSLEFDDISVRGKPVTISESPLEPEPTPEPELPPAPELTNFGLRGNPSFSEASLTSEERLWYNRLWAAVRHASPASNHHSQARSGNLYNYARPLNATVTVMLYAFRTTGDLNMLDEIDRLLQTMRAQLRTTWVDANGNSITPNDGTQGLRRWNYLSGSNTSSNYGKDIHIMDSVMTHSLIAEVALAYKMNADLSSPAGINYGERAGFWQDYLVNDFERIWRIRTGKSYPDMTLWSHQISHSWSSNVRWLYYMGRLTGEAAYQQEALVKGQRVLDNQLDISTASGTAKVWSHRLFDYAYGLQPFVYARYDWMILTSLHLDGFTLYDQAFMNKHAVTLAHFMMDNSSTDFSFDVGGMQDRTGTRLSDGTRHLVPTRDPWDGSSLTYARESRNRFAISPMTQLAAFDASGKIHSTADAVYRAVESDLENPSRPFIPAGILLSLRMKP